ncbi:MAG: hypothetical protein QOG62_527 [Thermoleophilaceae bacterium]|nr:hypothetical protein [Thermoleophilaceae bacterium]
MSDATGSGRAGTPVTAEATAQAEKLMDVLEGFFAAACAQDERLSRRLTVAETIWTAHITDADRSFTIYFDRFPIEFRREADPSAEVLLWGTAQDNVDIWTGHTFLGLSIANRILEYEGPVRKILRIVPMLRPLGHFGNFRELLPKRPS